MYTSLIYQSYYLVFMNMSVYVCLHVDLNALRFTLLQLLSGQAVVGGEACLSGSGESSLPAEGSTADEEVVILRSKLQQSEAVCRDLRRDLSHVKNDCLQLHGTKVRVTVTHDLPRLQLADCFVYVYSIVCVYHSFYLVWLESCG